MNILFILGNGFDLNLDLKTSFKNFNKYYIGIKSENKNVNKLKDSISGDFENWSDLEFKLGEFTKELNSVAELNEVIEDLVINLRDYIKSEEDKLQSEKVNKKKFQDSLREPYNFLEEGDRNKIYQHLNINTKSSAITINVVTFNYTNTLEKILDFSSSQKILTLGKTSFNGRPQLLNSILHIHGSLDKDMVLGVNDANQIVNESFNKNDSVLEMIVKPTCNKARSHDIDKKFTKLIETANLICIFGSSLGKTDSFWWQQICDGLKNKYSRLIIFIKDPNVNNSIASSKNHISRKMKERFMNNAHIDKEDWQKIEDKIFVAVNTSIFETALD